MQPAPMPHNRRMIIVYGIPNCASVKKARAWLSEHAVAYTFHDFKKQGVPEARLAAWLHAAGWERLLNRKGTTWRNLDPAAQAGVTDAATACALMRVQASVIKRPVIEWDPDARHVTVGFDPERFAAQIRAADQGQA